MAAFEAGAFRLVEVVMHPIPRGRAVEADPDLIEYSEAAVDLTQQDRAFIQRRLRASLGGYARPVVEDLDLGSEIPTVLRSLLQSSSGLVAHSMVAARKLHLQQKAVSPGGLVMTVVGEVHGTRCIVIAKMEHQEGMRVEQVQNAKGQRTYRAQHLRDLILGDGTRVFKVGVFAPPVGATLEGWVVDDQEGGGGVADYFIHYLGCQFRQQADVQTETFMKLAEKFVIQRTRDDPETNAAYEIALLAEMQSTATKIRPEQFAAEHLAEADQDLFVQRVRDAGLPTRSFTKDVSLIKSKIRRMRISTVRGADVYAPPDMYDDETLKIQTDEADGPSITIRDAIKQMSGASGKRSD